MKAHAQQTLPRQRNQMNQKTTPHPFATTVRTDYKRVLTTGRGGKFLPIMAIPLLREDRLRSTNVRFSFEMDETAEMLLNPVRIAVHAWLVPRLAFERFLDLGHLNRSYMGKPEADASVTPWFEMLNLDDGATPPVTAEIFKVLGMHTVPGQQVNADYIEAYNAVWNFIAEDVSPNITPRDWDDTTLAPAFWPHSAMRHVKPSFDQALQHGDVALSVSNGQMPVKGIGLHNQVFAETNVNRYETGATGTVQYAKSRSVDGSHPNNAISIEEDPNNPGFPGIYAELQNDGITLSLANIELAKRTAAFARARVQYQGLGDDDIIDLLMSGVRLPEEGMKQPILLGREDTLFGMTQRYATDAGNLAASVTRGQTMVDLTIRTPVVNTGGIVMAFAEILPEQMYERQRDIYLSASTVAELPDRLRDELDVEPVEIVTNSMIDTDHNTPDGVFGYAPLNHRWQREAPNIGGAYYRPRADAAWTETRNRIWAAENVDPTLGDDFFLATNLHHEVFEDTAADPFEISANALAQIEGLTYFGPALLEASGDYDAVMAKADLTRIEQS